MADINTFISYSNSSADFWESVEYSAMCLVFIGVVGEILADFSRISKSEYWKEMVGKWSAILLAIALAIELFATVKTNNINDAKIAELYLDAGRLGITIDGLHNFVEKKVQISEDQMNSFKFFAQNQKKQTDGIIQELNDDKIRLDKARDEALKAAQETKKDLADMELALEKERVLQQKMIAVMSPRTLSPEQQHTLVEKMLAWANLPNSNIPQSVAVFSTSGVFESKNLANQIAVVLEKAGWRVNRNSVHFGNPMSVSGVGLFSSSNPRGQSVAIALVNALNSEGIGAFIIDKKWKGCEDNKITTHIDTEPFCSHVSIMVGDHP